MGKIIRNMRIKNPVDALFPKIRQRILAATYGQPERWWFLSELAYFIGVTPSSLQREMKSLAASRILRQRRDGNRLYFQAETDSPVFKPLRELIAQTLGINGELKAALLPLTDKINCAFIFGSAARSEENTLSDIDLIIVGRAGLSELSPVVRPLEKRFSREINVMCYGAPEFAKKARGGNHFLASVLQEKKIFLIGDANELDDLIGEPNRAEAPGEPSGNTRPVRIGRA